MASSLVGTVLGRRLNASLRVLVAVSKMQLRQAFRSRLCRLPWLLTGRNGLPRSSSVMPTFALSSTRSSENLMLFSSEQSGDEDNKHGGSSGGGGERKFPSIKLMDYKKKLRWPNPINTLRNYIFSALIKISFDQEFSIHSFLAGAGQVICLPDQI